MSAQHNQTTPGAPGIHDVVNLLARGGISIDPAGELIGLLRSSSAGGRMRAATVANDAPSLARIVTTAVQQGLVSANVTAAVAPENLDAVIGELGERTLCDAIRGDSNAAAIVAEALIRHGEQLAPINEAMPPPSARQQGAGLTGSVDDGPRDERATSRQEDAPRAERQRPPQRQDDRHAPRPRPLAPASAMSAPSGSRTAPQGHMREDGRDGGHDDRGGEDGRSRNRAPEARPRQGGTVHYLPKREFTEPAQRVDPETGEVRSYDRISHLIYGGKAGAMVTYGPAGETGGGRQLDYFTINLEVTPAADEKDCKKGLARDKSIRLRMTPAEVSGLLAVLTLNLRKYRGAGHGHDNSVYWEIALNESGGFEGTFSLRAGQSGRSHSVTIAPGDYLRTLSLVELAAQSCVGVAPLSSQEKLQLYGRLQSKRRESQ